MKCPEFNLRASIFQDFPGSIPPDSPNISMLHMSIVFHTMEFILDSPSLSSALLSEDNTTLTPINPLHLILTPLTRILKETMTGDYIHQCIQFSMTK